MKQFETWSEMGLRQAIDSSALFKEVVRVRKALLKEKNSQSRERLNSLTRELDEVERLNKALRLGNTSPKMIGLLNDWSLQGNNNLVLGFDALHAYLAMAGARFKRTPSRKFDWQQHRVMTALLRRVTGSGELHLNTSEQVVFSKAGKMGLMRVLNPLSFIKFKKLAATQPGRSASQLVQESEQVNIVESLIAADLLSATYDQYE